MPVKNILITEPTNPILRQLAVQFLHKPDVRVMCFDNERGGGEEHLLQILSVTEQGCLRYSECSEPCVDEIWHTVNSAFSVEECRKKTERALLFANRGKAPILHYLSLSTITALSREPYPNGTPQSGKNEEKHLFDEAAVERAGCKFQIYRVPWSLEALFHPASEWAQFIQCLTRFKLEIEDRIPGYFTAQPLRLYLPGDGIIEIARTTDIVQAIEQILRSGMDGPYFHLHTPQPLLTKECLRMLVEFSGMRLEIVANREQQNCVDRLLDSRAEEFLRRLNQATTEAVPKNSSAGQVWLDVPPISAKEFAGACHSKLQEPPRGPGDWKSALEQKQVLLPDGSALNYYIGGEGPATIVLLNAYGQSFQYWERFIRAVSPYFRLILWMPRGNDGDTIGLRIASPQAVHADDLEKVLRAEDARRCTLLAWCSGPKLALEYYQRYPQRISAMLFVAASFKGLRQHKALETEYEKNLEPLLEAVEKYPETADVVLEYLRGILLSQDRQARTIDELAAISDRDLQQALSAVNVSLKELVLHPFHGANVVAYARQMCEFWKHDFIAGLSEIKVPVLFIGGDCDRIASQAIAKVIAEMMPQAKFLEISGGTHYIHYDRWDLLAEIAQKIVDSGRLEFSAPWTAMATVNYEPVTRGKAKHDQENVV